jgi:hypothetical protein
MHACMHACMHAMLMCIIVDQLELVMICYKR